jgi:hypothetical protein
MSPRLRTAVVFFVAFAVPVAAQATDLSKLFKRDQKPGLSDEKVVSGLKEALQIGSGNAVTLTGKIDGYFGNEAIRILMPDKLKTVEKGLRAVGFGSQVDDFVLSMNRAAESAAPHAREIFGDAIKQMSFQDARTILQGNETAATDYFKEKTSGKLAAAFRPAVEKSMQEAEVGRKYEKITSRYASIPFAKSPSFDINRYVVDKALGGLFHVLGEEETKIRKNPAARVTGLLKEIFGR